MAVVRAFSGIRYDPSQVEDISQLLCPPYDVITAVEREALYARHPHNYVRLEYASELLGDSQTDNKFQRSAQTLERWLAEGVLKTEATPTIYIHDHDFEFQGRVYRRRGIIARVRLEEWDRMVVRPHESTFAGPKSERLDLMSATSADISPVMALYDDGGGKVAELLRQGSGGEPELATAWLQGERHGVWAVTAPELVAALARAFADKPLYIADGHHRYESALTYMRERLAFQPDAPGDAPFNFVMMTLIDFTDAGLVLLPAHRLARGLTASNLSDLRGGLETFFEVTPWQLSDPDIWARVDTFLKEGAVSQDRLVLYGLDETLVHALKVKDFTETDKLMPQFHSEAYRRLSASVIDHVILEKLLGIGGGDQEARLAYQTDRDEVTRQVSGGNYQIALMLSPVGTSVIRSIADVSDRMPRKATYFYPKLPSGLVLYRLV